MADFGRTGTGTRFRGRQPCSAHLVRIAETYYDEFLLIALKMISFVKFSQYTQNTKIRQEFLDIASNKKPIYLLFFEFQYKK